MSALRPRRARASLSRRLTLVAAAGLVLMSAASCGDAEPTEPEVLDPTGTWQSTEAGVSETTLRLAEDGSFHRVAADLGGSTCESSGGTWTLNADQLQLRVTSRANAPVSETESYTIAIAGGQLSVQGSAAASDFRPTLSIPSCVDYGFGSWMGSLEATVDGEVLTFSDIAIRIDVGAGEADIEAMVAECSGCAAVDVQLTLRLATGSDELENGTFTVQNVPGATDTFYGLYHPEPGAAGFSGFDTSRLSPPGTFVLSAVGAERIAGTFSFRANPRVEGQTSSGGADFALFESGSVDLTYQ